MILTIIFIFCCKVCYSCRGCCWLVSANRLPGSGAWILSVPEETRAHNHTVKYLLVESRGVFPVKTPLVEGETIISEKGENGVGIEVSACGLLFLTIPGTGPLFPWKFSSSLAQPSLAEDGIHLPIFLAGLSVFSCQIIVNREKSAPLCLS